MTYCGEILRTCASATGAAQRARFLQLYPCTPDFSAILCNQLSWELFICAVIAFHLKNTAFFVRSGRIGFFPRAKLRHWTCVTIGPSITRPDDVSLWFAHWEFSENDEPTCAECLATELVEGLRCWLLEDGFSHPSESTLHKRCALKVKREGSRGIRHRKCFLHHKACALISTRSVRYSAQSVLRAGLVRTSSNLRNYHW
jgi:hypothetical protein